ncbi:MAG: hypothetical protein ABWZ27_12335, partial [Aestuariivirgaceae bacterium]
EEASDSLIPGFGSFLQYDIAGGHQIIIAGGASDIDTNSPRLAALGLSDVTDDDDHQLGWVVGAGANINLADIATFTAGAQYTEGLAARWMNQLATNNVSCGRVDGFIDEIVVDPDTGLVVERSFIPGDCDLNRAFGVTAGLTFNINDTTSFNIEGGFAENLDDDNIRLTDEFGGFGVENVTTVHANILWQPVKQMRLGWEVMWGRNNYFDKFKIDDDFTDTDEDVKICAVPDPDREGKCIDNSDALRFQFGAWFFF